MRKALVPCGHTSGGCPSRAGARGGVRRAADQDAPTAPGRLVELVDLEGDRAVVDLARHRGVRVGLQCDLAVRRHVVDRDHGDSLRTTPGQSANWATRDEFPALVLGELDEAASRPLVGRRHERPLAGVLVHCRRSTVRRQGPGAHDIRTFVPPPAGQGASVAGCPMTPMMPGWRRRRPRTRCAGPWRGSRSCSMSRPS